MVSRRHIMRDDEHRLIAAIHQGTRALCLALTGGGSGAASMLLAVPGASRTVLDVQIPYSEEALTRFLGMCPAQFCSEETALAMADAALLRATMLAPGRPAVGIGCTASLATDRPKRGDHRFFVAVAADDGARVISLTLEKGARSRAEEEELLDDVLLNVVG